MTEPTLKTTLDAISRDAIRILRHERRRHSIRPAIDGAVLSMLAVTAVYLACIGIAHWVGGDLATPATWIVIVMILTPGVMFYVMRVFTAGRSISNEAALTEADERFGLADRLRTADEFLRREKRSAFMEAALLDAESHAIRVRIRGLPMQPAPARFSTVTRFASFGLVVMFGVALWIPAALRELESVEPKTEPEVVQLEAKTETKTKNPSEQPVPPREREETTDSKTQPVVKPATGKGRKDAQLDTDVKKTRGAMGSGQSADAASASGNSEARGAPSSQAQASKAGKKPKKKKKKTKKKDRKPPDSTPTPAKKPEDDSGSTAGRGAASGSNKSPSASPWSSKDQVTSEDEEDLEDDEEVDDEFDNSDARGGVQPHLRDRRPPVNRDLGIGFGNGKNPDANGRGGPSEMKKSRGVASLVLGVPIPDHIKGRPNPGKTKITQERVEPKVEDPTPATATPRTPRRAPVGHFANPELEPWMRDLIRTYFKAIRLPSVPQPKKSGD